MSVDTISDFLTIIRNGLMARKIGVTIPHSHMKEAITKVLKDEGYIRDFSVEEFDGGKLRLNIALKYVKGEAVIHEITRISKLGRRAYQRADAITSVIGGLGISILTTSKGIITDRQARQHNVGGEVICHVW